MSLLLLIDGYNVVAPVAPPSQGSDEHWLQRERMLLINRLARRLDGDLRARTCVVFDAANPPRDRPDRFEVETIDVRFAVGYPEADDLIEELIAAHNAPKTLAVVSSDQRIQTAARRRGCTAFDSQAWLDDLLDGLVRLAIKRPSRAGQGSDEHGDEKPDQGVDDDDVEEWMREFGF
jgi:predicted RNA-binding protein with PIN domain